MAKDEKEACYQILSFGLWKNLVVYSTRLLLAKKFILKLFWRANIPPLKEELHVEENIVLEEYVEVKEENIEIFEEINEGLVIEEEPEIKIVEETNEDPIIEKDLEVEIVETIKEEIIKDVENLIFHYLQVWYSNFCLSSFTEPLNRPPKFINVFLTNIQSLMKFILLSFYSLVDSRPFLLVDLRTLLDSRNPCRFEIIFRSKCVLFLVF